MTDIICIKEFKGAPHGHTSFLYKVGDKIPAELHETALSNGWAEEKSSAPVKGEDKEEKNAGAAPENKGVFGGKKGKK